MNLELLTKYKGLLDEFHRTVVQPIHIDYQYKPSPTLLLEDEEGNLTDEFPQEFEYHSDNLMYFYYDLTTLINLYPDCLNWVKSQIACDVEETVLAVKERMLYAFQHEEFSAEQRDIASEVRRRALMLAKGFEFMKPVREPRTLNDIFEIQKEISRQEALIQWSEYNGLAGDSHLLLTAVYKGIKFDTLYNRNSWFGISKFFARRRIIKAIHLLSAYNPDADYEPKLPSWKNFITKKSENYGNA